MIRSVFSILSINTKSEDSGEVTSYFEIDDRSISSFAISKTSARYMFEKVLFFLEKFSSEEKIG